MPELPRQAKVDNVHNVAMLPNTHNNVAWFEITVDEVSGVDVTQATDLDIVRIFFFFFFFFESSLWSVYEVHETS